MIASCFEDAQSFPDGVVELCETFARLFESEARVDACPVLSILQATTVDGAIRKAANEVHDSWTASLTREAERLGAPDPAQAAFSLHVRLQGAWVFAFARQSAEPFRLLSAEWARDPY